MAEIEVCTAQDEIKAAATLTREVSKLLHARADKFDSPDTRKAAVEAAIEDAQMLIDELAALESKLLIADLVSEYEQDAA